MPFRLKWRSAIIALLIGFCCIVIELKAGEIEFAAQAGGPDPDVANGVALDRARNIYVTGQFQGSANFNGLILTSFGQFDTFVAKYDSSGRVSWLRHAGQGTGNGVAVDASGNVFVVGNFLGSANFGTTNLANAGSSDVFVAKYDNGGSLVWALSAGGPQDDYGKAIAVDKNGNCYITGGFKGVAFFGGASFVCQGPEDMFVAKISSSGRFEWVQRVGENGYDEGRGLTLDAFGNVFVSGMSGTGPTSMVVVKFKPDGDKLWASTIPRIASEETGERIAADKDGSVYVTGSQTVKIDSEGHQIWRKQASGIGIAVSAGQHVFVTGDQGLREYDLEGNLLSNEPFPATGRDWAVLPGLSVIAGEFSGTTIIGTNSLTSFGAKDILFASVLNSDIAATVSPPTKSIMSGDDVTFVGMAQGLPPLYYQWYFNGTNRLFGETNNNLTLANVTVSQSGVYGLLVTNVLSSGYSPTVKLTVIDSSDSDGDGIPKYWEEDHGLNPNDPSDAITTPNGERLTFVQKFRLGLDIAKTDFDGDGLDDYDELFLYGTNPKMLDSDSDGIPDGWEVLNGLDPRRNDIADDKDFDGLTNLEEFQWNQTHPSPPDQMDPARAFSGTNLVSDFERFHGGRASFPVYDRNDRLIGVQYSSGIALAYVYDGNGNLVRQKWLPSTVESNGLSSIFSLINGLTNGVADDGPYGDSDGDGWVNEREWKAGTNPRDAADYPRPVGNAGTILGTVQFPFVPTQVVLGVGNLDERGADEIVLAGDGNADGLTNSLHILTQQAQGWTREIIDIGPFGVTSLSVGQLTNRPLAAIYVGLRGVTNGSGRIVEFVSTNGIWQSNLVVVSSNETSLVLGLRGEDLIVSVGTSNLLDGALSKVEYEGQFRMSPFDVQESHRGLGSMATFNTNKATVRLLDSGGVSVRGGKLTFNWPTNSLVAYYPLDGSAADMSGFGRNGVDQGIVGAIDRFGNTNSASLFTSGSYVNLSSMRPLSGINNAFSVGAWIKPSNVHLGNIFVHRADFRDVVLGFAQENRISWGIYDSAGNIHDLRSQPLPEEKWVHVMGVYDGVRQYLYVDGVLSMSSEWVGNVDWDANYRGDGIGGHPFDNTYRFDGLIDELRVYSRAISGDELKLILDAEDGFTIAEPMASNRLAWAGSSIASGLLRATNQTSLIYSFMDDVNKNGVFDATDEFVTSEFVLNSTNATRLTLSRRKVESTSVVQAFALATSKMLNHSNEVLFTGEPDGRVYSWRPQNGTNELTASLFSAAHAGKKWMAMASIQPLEPGEAIVGLKVDPAFPERTEVIFWPSDANFDTNTFLVSETAPQTVVLPSPNSGGSLPLVGVRIWDNEGNRSLPVIQYQVPNSTSWSNATLLAVDGIGYDVITSTALNWPLANPSGVEHALLWNAVADLGLGYTNFVLIRARSRDVALTGPYSVATSFRIETSSVSTNLPPSVEIVFPTANQTFLTHDILSIRANASDLDGTVVRVEFFVDGALHGIAIDQPFQVALSNTGPATNMLLRAEAIDNAGGVGISEVVAVNLRHPATIRFDTSQLLAADKLRLKLSNLDSGRRYVVEFSTNLVSWSVVGESTSTNGVVEFNHAVTTNESIGFFRARILPE
jgi:YD repeat-containing protein